MKYAVVVFSLALLALVPCAHADFEAPVPVRTVTPQFPPDMRRQHINGLVLVSCQIDVQGNVEDPKVEKSTNDAFTQPAVDALKKWKFKPAHRDGSIVAVRVSIPLKFTIED